MYLSPGFTQMLCFCVFMCIGDTEQTRLCIHENNVTLECNHVPNNITSGTLTFVLTFDLFDTFVFNRTTFIGDNWKQLQILKFKDNIETEKSHVVLENNCFTGLEGLAELHINVWYTELFENSFSGLQKVNTLDMSGCGHILIADFILALNKSDILPGLQKLLLSNWNFYEGSFAFGDEFVDMLLPRNITIIDVSYSQLDELNFTALFGKLTTLHLLNCSHAIISKVISSTISPLLLKHLNMDFSHAVLPKRSLPNFPGKFIIYNQTINYSSLHHRIFKQSFAPQTVNFSGIIHISSILVQNVTLNVDINPAWFVETVIMQQNNLRKLDMLTLCETFNFPSVENLDLSGNGMEFIHPTLLSCSPNIRRVDLSKNQLFKMLVQKYSLFESLFSGLEHLRFVFMSANRLHTLPFKLFQDSKKIEIIDISYNQLEQVTFNLTYLENLKTLDLQHNKIQVLDPLSIQNLNSISVVHKLSGSCSVLILKANPLSCSTCMTKPFLTWLLTTDLLDSADQNLKCKSETGKLEDIDSNTVKLVEKICSRKGIMISVGISAAAFLIIQITCLTIIYRRYKGKQIRQSRNKVLNNLRRGHGKYQFVTFLASSSEDEEFVKTHIFEQLNENLQLMTGIDRNLVCEGDQHFRPGFYVHNEAFRLLDTAAVVVVVVSNNFCASDFCRNELDQAYVKRKPIILMFIEHVDPEVMMPMMKELYQKNVRILWTVENGERVLKTTWQNVCTSILDIINCEE